MFWKCQKHDIYIRKPTRSCRQWDNLIHPSDIYRKIYIFDGEIFLEILVYFESRNFYVAYFLTFTPSQTGRILRISSGGGHFYVKNDPPLQFFDIFVQSSQKSYGRQIMCQFISTYNNFCRKLIWWKNILIFQKKKLAFLEILHFRVLPKKLFPKIQLSKV